MGNAARERDDRGTVTLRTLSEGGVVQDQDLPTAGTAARERFDGFVASGKWSVLGRVVDGELEPWPPSAVADHEPEPEPEPEPDLEAVVVQLDRPARNASGQAWLEYAVQQGANPDEAAGLGRDELIGLVDQLENNSEGA